MPAETQASAPQSPRSAPEARPSRGSRRLSASPHQPGAAEQQRHRRRPTAGSWARRRRSRPRDGIARRAAMPRATPSDETPAPTSAWCQGAPRCGGTHQTMPGLDHRRAQARELAVDELSNSLPAITAGVQLFFSIASAQDLRLGGLEDHVGQRLALVRRDAGRAVDATPVADLDVDALLLQRRHVDALQARGRGDGDRAHLAALDVLLELAVAAAADGDVAAEDRRDGLAAAAEGT